MLTNAIYFKASWKTVFALKQVGWGPDGKPANQYGHNYRITEMQAVLLRGGLTRLTEQTRIRDENAQYIAERLGKIGGPLRAARRDPNRKSESPDAVGCSACQTMARDKPLAREAPERLSDGKPIIAANVRLRLDSRLAPAAAPMQDAHMAHRSAPRCAAMVSALGE